MTANGHHQPTRRATVAVSPAKAASAVRSKARARAAG
jgi:hypothetical protein